MLGTRRPGAKISTSLGLLGLSLALALALVWGAPATSAQTGGAAIDTSGLDSAGRDSLRIADSTKAYNDSVTFEQDRKSTRLNSSHSRASRMPSSA